MYLVQYVLFNFVSPGTVSDHVLLPLSLPLARLSLLFTPRPYCLKATSKIGNYSINNRYLYSSAPKGRVVARGDTPWKLRKAGTIGQIRFFGGRHEYGKVLLNMSYVNNHRFYTL